ncbi:hypothetical protein CPC08DRAFT_711503 [Agrocybe pediades]|nr:hypothetical protein CPC08DRAFT_711503 [Agrocybe pediades]
MSAQKNKEESIPLPSSSPPPFVSSNAYYGSQEEPIEDLIDDAFDVPSYEAHSLALDALIPTMNMHTQGHATDPYNEHPEDPLCQSVRKGLARHHFVDEYGLPENALLGGSYYAPDAFSADMNRKQNEEELIYESAGADYYGYPSSYVGVEEFEGRTPRAQQAMDEGKEAEWRRLALWYALDAARLSATGVNLSPEEAKAGKGGVMSGVEVDSAASDAGSSLSSDAAGVGDVNAGHHHPSSSAGSNFWTKPTPSILADWIEPREQRGANPEGIGMLDQVGSASGTWRFFRRGGIQGEGFVRGAEAERIERA